MALQKFGKLVSDYAAFLLRWQWYNANKIMGKIMYRLTFYGQLSIKFKSRITAFSIKASQHAPPIHLFLDSYRRSTLQKQEAQTGKQTGDQKRRGLAHGGVRKGLQDREGLTASLHICRAVSLDPAVGPKAPGGLFSREKEKQLLALFEHAERALAVLLENLGHEAVIEEMNG